MTKDDLIWIVEAYKCLIEKDDMNAWFERRNDDSRYIDRMLITKDWYHGRSKFIFYKSSFREAIFTKDAIEFLSLRFSQNEKAV